ncbi:MAG: lactonase family protein [Lachnospiraceae bacterium]|nr:lactonase family protein [Lachnospiraceae bacterium]
MKTYCYVGNWGKEGEGFSIVICAYDPETGALTELKRIAPEISVGCLYQKDGILYCTHERETLDGLRAGGGGLVLAYTIDPQTGGLKEISQMPSCGAMAAYVVAQGDYVVAVNHATRDGHVTVMKRDRSGKYHIRIVYDESMTALFSRRPDGSVGELLDIFRTSGCGPVAGIQNSPHIHSVQVSPSGNLYCICDKGSDRVYLLRIEGNTLQNCGSFRTGAGYAPRYSVFHPQRPYLYVNNELQPYLYALRYTEEGRLSEIASVRVLPEDIENPAGFGQSDLRISADGRFLYDLFRGVNAVAVFWIDEESGRPERIQYKALGGETPRGCALSPDGKHLLIAAIGSGEAKSFPVREDGTLGDQDSALSCGTPGCLSFYTV